MARHIPAAPPARHRSPAAPPARHRSLPAAPPARHRSLQPAKPAPRSGFFHRGRNADFALHRGRNSDFAFFARKTHHRASAGGPSARLSSRVPLTECFFHHSHAHSILAWAQDCSTQSWRGHRIAPLNPGVGTGLPRCLPENSGSASLHRDALPDLPPGFPLQIWEVTQRKWGRSSCFLRQSIAANKPLTPWCPWCHAPRAIKIGQNRGSSSIAASLRKFTSSARGST